MRRAESVARAAVACSFLLCVGAIANFFHAPVEAQVFRGIPLNCFVPVSTATTLAAVGGSCTARQNGNAIYITDIMFSTNVSAIGSDAHNTLKYGTGTNCGTGTTTFWAAFSTAAALTNTPQSLLSPLRIPPGNDICWINSTAGSKVVVLNGYEAP